MVIVIGAGVVGASVAWNLARAGAAVVVLDSGRVAGGTSTHSFAWVNALFKTPVAYQALNVGGIQAHADLRAHWHARGKAATWWHGGGTLTWQTDDAALAAEVRQCHAAGYAAQAVDAHQARTLEPDVPWSRYEGAFVAHFPQDGWVDPAVYCSALLDDAQRQGAQVRPFTRVAQLLRDGARVVGVQTEAGERLGADTVINCTGRWADQPALAAAQPLPLAPTGGLKVFTPPVAHRVQRVIYSPKVHIRPDGAGRLLVCRNDWHLPPHAQPEHYKAEAAHLLQAAQEVLPLLAGVPVEALRIGVRAQPKDSYPVVGAHPQAPGLYSVVTHSGVTLAPHLGALAAQEVLNGVRLPALAPYRPERLMG